MNKRTIFILAVFFAGCAASMKSVWRTFPEVGYSYRDAWALIQITINEKYPIKKSDVRRGYIESGWKLERNAVGQPKIRRRVILQVRKAKPLQFDFKVERQKHKSFAESLLWGELTKNWKPDGNDREAEEELEKEFASKLGYGK